MLAWSLARLMRITPHVAIAGTRPAYLAIAETVTTAESMPPVTPLDDPVSDVGPLAGLVASLAWAEQQGASWLLTIPVDVPLLPTEALAALAAHVQSAASAARPVPHHFVHEGHPHWLCAAWPVGSTLLVARARLDARRLALHELHRELGSLPFSGAASAESSAADWFANLNAPEDMQHP